MSIANIRRALPTGAAAAMLLFVLGCSSDPPVGSDPPEHVATDQISLVSMVHSEPLPPEVHQALAAARASTAQYHRAQQGEAAGYALPPPPAPLHECIAAEDGHGAMGLHYINGSNVDAELDVAHPEALVYEPTENGRLRLVALEYVVFEEAWEAEHGDTIPQLFGRDLTYVGAPNRYELPAFYQIHAWVWKNNPDGIFADHNPRVSCPAGQG